MRGIPYRNLSDFHLGVEYLQLMGVRYYAAFTPEAKAAAAKEPALRVIATVPDLDGQPPSGWTIYRVADSPTVAPLAYQPVVATNLAPEPNWKCTGSSKPLPTDPKPAELSAWECLAVPWWNDPDALDRPITDSGPASWVRASVATARNVERRPLPDVTVSRIRTTETSVSFHVSRTGVPVMVRTSYYPNWKAEGAVGPWRATPNFMVVVPTSHDVRVVFATSGVEWLGRLGTLAGLGGLGMMVATAPGPSGRRRRRRPALSSLLRRQR